MAVFEVGWPSLSHKKSNTHDNVRNRKVSKYTDYFDNDIICLLLLWTLSKQIVQTQSYQKHWK